MFCSVLTCVICRQTASELITLDCCYSVICLKCHKQNKNNENCPKCYKKLDFISKKPDIFLKDYQKFLTDYKKTHIYRHICECCDIEVDEMMNCIDCSKVFCNKCFGNIHSIGRYKAHKRINLRKNEKITNFYENNEENIEIFCAEHENEKIEAICFKENKLLCAICMANHNLICKTPSYLNLK